jgi:TonB family protein
MEMARGYSSFRSSWFTRWPSFYLISASLHALIFTFPLAPPFETNGHAIPVTLLIARDGSSDELTPEENAITAKKSAKPPSPSKRQAALNKTVSHKNTEGLGSDKRTEEIAKIKIPSTLTEKKPQKKASETRMDAESTMTNVSKRASLSTDHRSAVSKSIRKGKVQTLLSTPSPGPTKSSQADTNNEIIVRKDNSGEEESAVEISALLEDLDEADISEPEEPVREIVGNEANEEHFSKEAPPETTIALRSRQQDDGSRVLRRAGYAHKINPEYPERARREGWEGTTLLRVLVDRQGISKTIQVSQSSGFALLDGAAVKAVEQWRFYPAQNGNGPVESWVRVPILFRLVRDQH